MRQTSIGVAFIGFGGIIVTLLLYFSVSRFSDPGRYAGAVARFREVFSVDEVYFTTQGDNAYLDYMTSREATPEAQRLEMDTYGRYIVDVYKGVDKNNVKLIKVTRSEVHGSGCFRDKIDSTLGISIAGNR